MAKIALELDKLTSFNFGWGVLRWVAWTIWSDACLLDQITYVIFLNNTQGIISKNTVLHSQKLKLDLQWPTCIKRLDQQQQLEKLDLQSYKVFPSAQGKMGKNGQPLRLVIYCRNFGVEFVVSNFT